MHQSKILVADDCRTVRAVVCKTLSEAGYDVTLASDGQEAVQFARRDRPDLVILDLQMPVVDGYTACAEILALEDRPLPIILLTNDTANHLAALGSELGAYLHKPVTETQLLSTVGNLLGGSELEETCTGTTQ